MDKFKLGKACRITTIMLTLFPRQFMKEVDGGDKKPEKH